MKVTQNLKDKVSLAKKAGYTHVSSICNKYRYTTYRHYTPISDILLNPVGTNFTRSRITPGLTSTQFYNINPNAQTITCADLYKSLIINQNQEQ